MPVYKDIVYFDWTLVFTIINTIILFFLVKHFLYKPVKKMLQARQDEVEKIYSDADKAQSEAEKMKSEYELQLATAKEQAGEIVKTATAKAQQKSDEIVAEAQQKASVTLSRAQEQLELDRKKAVKEIRDNIADLAIDAASIVVGRELDEKSNAKLIDDFIENAGEVKWQN